MRNVKPPADLWEQLDAIRESAGIIERPEGSFTVAEWAKRYNITHDSAKGQIERLVSKGKVKRLGSGFRGVIYYAVVN